MLGESSASRSMTGEVEGGGEDWSRRRRLRGAMSSREEVGDMSKSITSGGWGVKLVDEGTALREGTGAGGESRTTTSSKGLVGD